LCPEEFNTQWGSGFRAFDWQVCICETPPDRLVDIVDTDVVQEFQSVRIAHFEHFERGFVEEAGIFASLNIFITDRVRPVVVRLAFRLVPMRGFLFVGLEPVGSFPAGLLTKVTSQVA
jgi:hypothetical protein